MKESGPDRKLIKLRLSCRTLWDCASSGASRLAEAVDRNAGADELSSCRGFPHEALVAAASVCMRPARRAATGTSDLRHVRMDTARVGTGRAGLSVGLGCGSCDQYQP